MTLVSGRAAVIGRNATMAGGGVIYGARHVSIGRGATVKAALLSPQRVVVHRSATVEGVIAGQTHVHVDRETKVTGSVVSESRIQVGREASVTAACGSIATPPGLGTATSPPSCLGGSP